jgi:hypothetical protein
MAVTEEPVVPLAILISGFLSPLDITDIRGKLSGRSLPWSYQDYPKVMAKLRATQLRIDWLRFHYLPPGQSDDVAPDTTATAGLDDKQIARLLIPIQISDQFRVTAADRSARFPIGAMCFIDHRRRYAMVNGDRRITSIHLMMDVYGNDQLRRLIRAAATTGRDAVAQA